MSGSAVQFCLPLSTRIPTNLVCVGRVFFTFTSATAAIELWSFGEDELAERMADIADDRMHEIWRTAVTYNSTDFPLPVTGRNITLGHVVAFACMFHLEGRLRPLSRQRRRPKKNRPERYLELVEEKRYQTFHDFVHGAADTNDSKLLGAQRCSSKPANFLHLSTHMVLGCRKLGEGVLEDLGLNWLARASNFELIDAVAPDRYAIDEDELHAERLLSGVLDR